MLVTYHIDGISRNNLSYAEDMRKLLEVCEMNAMNHGLKYNVLKSQYMLFGSGHKHNLNDVNLHLTV